MDVPRLFKAATPDLVARKVFRIKTVRRDGENTQKPPPKPTKATEPPIELKVVAPDAHLKPSGATSSGVEVHVNDTSVDTSSTDTATPRMDPKVPVLAVGTYHRKEAAPILAAAARLDLPAATASATTTLKEKDKEKSNKEPAPPLPHPSECGQPCVSGQSQMFQHRTTNAQQGPPPNRPMPRPPAGMMTSGHHQHPDHDYTNDYEDPEEMARNRGDGFTNHLLIKTTPPPGMMPSANFNSYEMSMSQQRRSQQQHPMAPPLSDCWGSSSGPDGGVLHKNADGAYYIPSGSLRTTSSTLSPASGQRYLDQPHTSGAPNSAYSDASTTLLKYPFNAGTQQNRRRQQVGTMSHGDHPGVPPGLITNPKKKKKLDEDSEGVCSRWPSKWNLLLGAALLVALLIICLLLFRAPSYVYTQPAPDATSSATSSVAHRYQDMGLRALPPAISLGERVDVEFFPKSMATTELTITKPTRIVFNATVGSGAQLVLLMSAGVHPSLSLHDALFPIRADRMRDPRGPLHIVEERSRSRRSSGNRPVEILSPRSATFEQFLLEGRHYLTFINERSRVEPISFLASELPKKDLKTGPPGTHPLAPLLTCDANCNQRGECVQEKCKCAPGYTGNSCEEAICPVVCSGNGVFSGGICVCKQGFKGRECEMRQNWCEVADCNGKGRCDSSDGRCRCNPGWTGDSCESKACPHPNCLDRGVCVNGTCYCRDGWRGADCGVFVDLEPKRAKNLEPGAPKKSKLTTLGPQILEKEKKKDPREVLAKKDQDSGITRTPCLHGTLIDTICHCHANFSAPDCSRASCPCVNGDCHVDGTCHCWKGFRGPLCEHQKCAIGCEEHGKCMMDGRCQCQAGWNGENCAIDGCPSGCSSKGECILDRPSSTWSCRCQSGSTGSDCSIPIEMHCDDGLDNDSDGLIDCDDPECCSSPACASESVCSTSASPIDVVIRMPPVFNANFAQRVGFLIMEKSVQSYTDAGQFNESLTSVVRGRVVWRGNSGASGAQGASGAHLPLIGVRVSDAAHPLYGFTLTRSDGYFDLVVNGARSVNLQFLRTQFQSVKKSVWVPPRQIVHVDDIVLHRSTGATPLISAAPARAKCSPTLRKLPDVTLISNLASDGISRDSGDSGDSSKLVVDSRTIFESLPILGTDLTLVYDSGRSPSAPSTLLIGLLDDKVDKELRKIHLTISIAGRRFDTILAPRTNLTHVFAWDKLNSYRQSESGLVPVTVRVGYEYAGCERDSERVWLTRRHQMIGATVRRMWGKMWTIDAHHHLDIVNNIVEMGDGGLRIITESEPRVTTIAGVDGAKRDVECSVEQCDGRLEHIPLFRPTTVVYAQDGSLIIGDHNLIRRISPDGSINTILTLGLADTSHSYYVAVSPVDGTIAVSLPLHKQVWKISSVEPQDSRNNYDVLAGDGTVCASAVDSCGDGGLAQNAQLIFPKGIAFDKNGNLYLSDSRRIRIIDTSGHIRSIGETTPDQHPIRTCAQLTKLVDLQLEWPTALSVDQSTGSVLILDTNVVYEIDVEHEVVTIALGAPTTCDILNSTSSGAPGSSGASHLIQNARDIHVASDGSIYIVESDGRRLNQVRRLSPDRSDLSVILGGRGPCSCDVAACGCDDTSRETPGSRALLNSPHAVCTGPSGDLIVADSGNAKVKKVVPKLANYDGRSRHYEVIDSERAEKYTFNRHGQHTSTVSLITGRIAYNFSYQSDSHSALLSEIKAASGIALKVVKHNNSMIDLETSLGEITTLSLSTYDETLEQISRRGSSRDVTRLAYTAKHLLSSRIDTASAVGFEYDEFGRALGLRRDREHWRLTPEVVIMSRVNTDVTLNGHPYQHVRLGPGDVAITDANQGTTRLISLQGGYSMISPLGTSSLFDKSSDKSTDKEEPVISRRRTTVPAILDRRALTTRWDWRHVARRGEDKRRVAEINGINMFSLEYNVAANSDTLRLGSQTDESQELLKIDYTDSGRIRRILAPESDDVAEMNVTWDSEGRKTDVAWGSWRHHYTYDSENRLLEHSIDGARVPVKMTYSGVTRRPGSVKLDASTWLITYDNYERVKEVSSSSGESTTFSSVALGGAEWVLKRRTALNSKPSLIRIDRYGRIVEAATPDGMHHWLERKDALGRTTEVMNDEATIVVTSWDSEGRIQGFRSDEGLQENTTMQGHLVSRRQITWDPLGTPIQSSFTYEYDDLFRVTTIQPTIEHAIIEPLQITYDESRGHVNTINGFTWARDPSTSRCQGHGMMYETSKANANRQIVQRKLIFGDSRATLRISRDRVGRPGEVTLEVGENVKTTRTFDASGQLASVDVTNVEPLRIQWNSDQRVEKINDQIVEWSRGGSLKRFLDSTYSTDSQGWVLKRNNVSFGYDGLGRLVRASGAAGAFRIHYDLQNRVVRIQKAQETTNLYYGYIHQPNLVSHFSRNSKISTIFYDDDQNPFALQTDDGSRFGLLTDETRTLRVILSATHVTPLPHRGPFGATGGPVVGPYVPLGFLGGIEIPELQISILKNGRPLDLISGRYLSVSPEAVARLDFNDGFGNSVDLMALETWNQPFGVQNIPEDFPSWFRLSGLSPSLLPSAHLGLPLSAPITHRLLSSFPQKLAPLTHLTTVLPTRLSSGSLSPSSESQWSIEDVGFANLLILTEQDSGDVHVEPLPTLSAQEHEVVKKLFENVKSLDFATWGLVPARHLWRVPGKNLELSSAAFSHFTMVVNKENVELRNGKSKIVVHFAEKKDELIKRLVDELRARETIPVWRAERKRLEAGEKTWRQWTDREQRELTSKGSVSGYDIEMKPAHQSALLASVHSWKFRKTA